MAALLTTKVWQALVQLANFTNSSRGAWLSHDSVLSDTKLILYDAFCTKSGFNMWEKELLALSMLQVFCTSFTVRLHVSG